jgi:hypothetical protein
MRKLILAACAAVLLVPASADAGKLETRYSALYHAAADKLGKDAVGRNIRRNGVRTSAGVREARGSDYARSIATLDRWLHPAPAPVVASAAAAPQSAPHVAQGAGSGGMPACADESHGNYSTGPANTNASSGATGRWQTLRSHYNRGGICQEFDVNSPSGQDGCAHKILEEQGASAWVGC